ncbi:MAG: hypothetical protein E6H64_13035 [Betaproteobacteria bacterium]|nr:MAG: hypothetical protein E6H64_13035 [Betaproteobacteria bacterium]
MPDACTLCKCGKDRQGTFRHAPAEDSRCGRATIARSVFVVASGDNRVSETKVAEKVGAPLAWADGDFVRSATGYAIGGVAPIGYSYRITVLQPIEAPAGLHLGVKVRRRQREPGRKQATARRCSVALSDQ